MERSITCLDDIAVLAVSGDVDSRAAGHLYDVLVERIRAGWTKLVVDVADVTRMTHAGIDGLVIAARLLQNAGGEMRICGANPVVRDFLSGLGFHHQLHLDASRELSVWRLTPQALQALTREEAA